jgi:hypothetical protein
MTPHTPSFLVPKRGRTAEDINTFWSTFERKMLGKFSFFGKRPAAVDKWKKRSQTSDFMYVSEDS